MLDERHSWLVAFRESLGIAAVSLRDELVREVRGDRWLALDAHVLDQDLLGRFPLVRRLPTERLSAGAWRFEGFEVSLEFNDIDSFLAFHQGNQLRHLIDCSFRIVAGLNPGFSRGSVEAPDEIRFCFDGLE